MKELKIACAGMGAVIGSYLDMLRVPGTIEEKAAVIVGMLGVFVVFVGLWEAVNKIERLSKQSKDLNQ